MFNFCLVMIMSHEIRQIAKRLLEKYFDISSRCTECFGNFWCSMNVKYTQHFIKGFLMRIIFLLF